MAVNEITKAESEKLLRKNIKLISGNSNKLNNLIHETAIEAAKHAYDYKNTNFCAELVNAMPMSYRRGLLIKWFEAFTPVGIGKDNKSGQMRAHLRGKPEERDAMWNLEAAKATPWYSDAFTGDPRSGEPDVPTLESVMNNVTSFVKRLETAINGTPDKKPGESGYKPGMEDGPEKKIALARLAALKKAALPNYDSLDEAA